MHGTLQGANMSYFSIYSSRIEIGKLSQHHIHRNRVVLILVPPGCIKPPLAPYSPYSYVISS